MWTIKPHGIPAQIDINHQEEAAQGVRWLSLHMSGSILPLELTVSQSWFRVFWQSQVRQVSQRLAWGSVTRPALWCGYFGLRPTLGAVSPGGIEPFCP